MTKKEWMEIAGILVAAYGPHRFPPETLKIWYELLEGEHGGAVKDAVIQMVKTQPFPALAHITRASEAGSYWKLSTYGERA